MKITIYTKEKKYEFASIYDKNYLYTIKHAHQENEPAKIWYYENGNIELEFWYINGKLHRENGAAKIWYNKNSKIEYKEYHINGNSYSKNDFNKEILKRKIQLI